MKKYSILTRLSIAITAAVLLNSAALAQSPSTFNTTVRNYAYIGKAGYNANVASIRLHISSNPDQADGAFDTGQVVTFTNVAAQSLNAAGINGKDGYMYALEYLYIGPASQGGSFYRVGANAVAECIGVIPSPTAADAGRTIQGSFVNLASGMIDSAGNYWFTGYTYHSLGLSPTAANLDFFLGKISGISNLTSSNANTTLSPTYYKLDISDTTFQRGMTNLMRQQAAMVAYAYSPTNSDGGWQDMDINPANGQLYSYIGFPSTPPVIGNNPYPKPPMQSYLARIDNTVTPWKICVINGTSPTTTPNREEDGAWFDGTGIMHVSFTDGEYAKVNLTTGALDTIAQSALPLSSGNLRGDFATNTPFALLPPITPLPVTLLDFSARTAPDGAEISWTTGVEANLNHFDVERSIDGQFFDGVAHVLPKGSNSTYSITDNPAAPIVFYRLKMTDNDATVAYSPVVKLSGNKIALNTAIYPSIITGGVLYLNLPLSATSLRIYSLLGKTVEVRSFDGSASHAQIELLLPAGSYLARLSDGATGAVLNTARIIVP